MRFTLSYPHEIEKRRRELGMSLEDVSSFSRIDYMLLKDMETGKRTTIAANDLDALCDVLDITGDLVCYDYFKRPPELKLKLVYVQAELLLNYLNRTGMNASQFAKRAGIAPQIVYAFQSRQKRGCKAYTAVKMARAMGIEPEEFCPAFALYSAEEIQVLDDTEMCSPATD